MSCFMLDAKTLICGAPEEWERGARGARGEGLRLRAGHSRARFGGDLPAVRTVERGLEWDGANRGFKRGVKGEMSSLIGN